MTTKLLETTFNRKRVQSDITILQFSKNQTLNILPKLKKLLAHKNPLTFKLFDLFSLPEFNCEVEHFIAVVNDSWVGNITLYHSQGFGLVGNVFVERAYRNQGIAGKLLQSVDYFAMVNGHNHYCLWLNIFEKPAAFHLYKKHKYLQPWPFSGTMIKAFNKADISPSKKINLAALEWKHYPALNYLFSQGKSDILMTLIHSCYFTATFELEFIKAMLDPEEKKWAILNQQQQVIGAVFVRKDLVWQQQLEACETNSNYLIDVVIHGVHQEIDLEPIKLLLSSNNKYTCYTNIPGPKYDLLVKVMPHVGTLKNKITWQGKSINVAILTNK